MTDQEKSEKRRAIVTGGAGFIGSHLVRRLLQEGWSVLVVDNLSSGYRHNVPLDAQFTWMDVTQEDSVTGLPEDGTDVLFHLASHVGQELSFRRPVFDFKANGLSTLILLKWCMEHKVKQFIFASSMNVYGNVNQSPVSETGQIHPPSPYAVGKIASEYLCRIYQDLGVNSTCLRLFNIYGPMQDMENMMQGMVSIYMAYVARREPILMLGSPERFRDFVYVTDAVDAFYRCVDEKAYNKVYNVATGRKTFVHQLLKGIIEAFGSDPESYPVTYGNSTTNDQFGIFGDASLISRDLGWKPSIDLKEGITKMAAWVKGLEVFHQNDGGSL